MKLAGFSIRNPVFVTCVFFILIVAGCLSFARLRTELYPDVSFPVVEVTVPFPGSSPEEVEAQVIRPLENAVSDLAGVRTVRSTSLPGAGILSVVFTLGSEIHAATQSVTEAVGAVRGDLPPGAQEPEISAINPSEVPLMTLALAADVPPDRLSELAIREIRPALGLVPQVGRVEIEGARRAEIHADLDREKLAGEQMSASEVVNTLKMSGLTVPVGQVSGPKRDTLIRSVGEFDSLEALRSVPIRFVGNEAAVTLGDIATVKPGLNDEMTRAYLNGRRSVVLDLYRERGADTLPVARAIRAKVDELNANESGKVPGFRLAVAYDGTRPIKDGVDEATHAIEIGILLTIVVVLFFLGSLRSTVITGVALPNSILGAFLLMDFAGFSLNITTLAALSLAVGLLIDDAIVVRESIFRHISSGEDPRVAATRGTSAVALPVIATTLTVLSVFGPIAFLHGIIGQFFKEFGLTVCFAMLISLLDSLTVAPMLSAYFAGSTRERRGTWRVLRAFERGQEAFERAYARALGSTLRRPALVLLISAAVFAGSYIAFDRLPKTFLPPSGAGEFEVTLTAPPGTSLDAMDQLASQADQIVRSQAEVAQTLLKVGDEHGQSNEAQMIVLLVDSNRRSASTRAVKDRVRSALAHLQAESTVQDIVAIGGGAGQPYVLHLIGEGDSQDLSRLQGAADTLVAALKRSSDLTDVQSSSQAGASEFRILYDPRRMKDLGVTSGMAGEELRILQSGATPARFHQGGEQYDVRVRLRPSQRDLEASFSQILVPNLNHRLVPLHSVADGKLADSPSRITRENRKRFVEISADLAPAGRGLARAISETRELIRSGAVKLPPGISFEFAGQTRDFQELLSGVVLAILASIAFMYLILASLYGSFFIPLAIMLVLPLAICGALYALLAAGKPLEINSMIGCILLLGVAAKNSILLVDHIQKDLSDGMKLGDAVLAAGRVRLRPILMTTFALIAGMLPVAFPRGEAAQQRAGMAIAVIGGLVSSTLLTLFVIPAAYGYLLKVQNGVARLLRPLMRREEK